MATPGNGSGFAQAARVAAAPTAPKAPPKPPVTSRDLIAEIRARHAIILESMAEVDGLLTELAGQHDAVTKLRDLFQQLGK